MKSILSPGGLLVVSMISFMVCALFLVYLFSRGPGFEVGDCIQSESWKEVRKIKAMGRAEYLYSVNNGDERSESIFLLSLYEKVNCR